MLKRFAALGGQASRTSDELPDWDEPAKDPHFIPLSDAELADAAEREANADGPREPFFGIYALPLYDTGWMPIPQTRDDSRRPGNPHGRAIHWGEYRLQRPDRNTVWEWCQDVEATFLNVAVLLGPPSGNAFVLDLDIYDDDTASGILELAYEKLGQTITRFANPPKKALVYRVADAADLPANQRFVLADADGEPSRHMIEVLSTGKMLSFHGRHYTTGRRFQYRYGQPGLVGPDAAALVTPAQLQEFFAAVAEAFPLYTPPARAYDVEIESVGDGSIRMPGLPASFAADQWIERDGRIWDGREAFLWWLVRETARLNAKLVMSENRMALAGEIRTRFRDREHQARAWTSKRLDDGIYEKLNRAARMLETGMLRSSAHRLKTVEGGKTVLQEKIPARNPKIRPADHDTFEWLGKNRAAIPVTRTPGVSSIAVERALRTDRDTVGREASAAVEKAVDAFLDEALHPAAREHGRVHVVAGPTGIGKSTAVLKRLAAKVGDLRDLRAQYAGTDDAIGPVVMIVPQYRNVDELRLKASFMGLDPNASDEELEAEAAERGLIAEDEVQRYLADLRSWAKASDLQHMTYQGKARAGCQRPAELALLQQAHVPSSSLCRKTTKVTDSQGRFTGEEREVFCPFYSTCAAIQQRTQIEGSDLVFLVRPFLTLAIPEELQNPAAVIIDERFFDLLAKTTTFPAKTLTAPRREPALTKKEREAGMSPLELLQEREHAVTIVQKAWADGVPLGKAFAEFIEDRGQNATGRQIVVRGIDLVRSARRVNGSAMTSQADLSPEMTLEEISALCTVPSGSFVAEEYRFWKLVEEQTEQWIAHLRPLDGAVTRMRLYAEGKLRDEPLKDNRIRVLDGDSDDKSIQISWLVRGNWSGSPTLLLDASTDPEITRRVLGGRDVVTHEIDVSLAMRLMAAVDRRLAMRNFFPGPDADALTKRMAAELLAMVRVLICSICGAHANGRVLIALPKKLRRAVLIQWSPPGNADFIHHGAVAGLDFARRHVAIVSIGRMELPVREIDGLVAALSYGDAEPETPIDVHGTGSDEEGKTIYPNVERRILKMRDGSEATYDGQEHAGPLARRVQNQYREEELRQVAGRGRPVYREDPVTVYAVTESIPADMICDDVCSFDDLAKRVVGTLWDAGRMCQGVFEPRILAKIADHLGDAPWFEQQIQRWIADIPSVRRHYHEYRVIYADGTESTAFVAGWLDGEAVDALKYYLQSCGRSGRIRLIQPCECIVEAADTAPVDDTALALAAMPDPARVEHEKIAPLRDLAKKRGEWRKDGKAILPGRVENTAPSTYRVGSGEHERIALSMGAWLAMDALADAWVQTGEMPGGLVPAPAVEPVADNQGLSAEDIRLVAGF